MHRTYEFIPSLPRFLKLTTPSKSVCYVTSGIDLRPFWLGYEALMKHAFLHFEWKVIFQRNCDAASVERWNINILHHIITSHNFMTRRWQPKTTVSALFGLSSMASQRAFNKSSPTSELSLQSIYDIHLIPKWRPINYSFVCMFISPFCLIFTSKFFCFIYAH